MQTASTTQLIINAFADYGSYIIIILSLVVSIGVAYLVFKFGWRKVKTSVGGQYEVKTYHMGRY